MDTTVAVSVRRYESSWHASMLEKEGSQKALCSMDETAPHVDAEAATPTAVATAVATLSFKVVFAKQTFDVALPADSTVQQLTQHLEGITHVPACTQKLMFKGVYGMILHGCAITLAGYRAASRAGQAGAGSAHVEGCLAHHRSLFYYCVVVWQLLY